MSPRQPHRSARPPSRRMAGWGFVDARHAGPQAQRIEARWRWPVVLSLLATIPAFYVELLSPRPSRYADVAYLVAALMLGLALAHVLARSSTPGRPLRAHLAELLLIAGLLLSAALPPSNGSPWVLALRLGVAFLTLLRMVWSLQHLIARGSLGYLIALSALVLGACGAGFWWLEPTTPDLPSGLWLAFTTAATVGYGDLVPTTSASRIFAVFVVLLGYGVLSLVTAALAARWVETEERRIEREILHDMRQEMAAVRAELAALRDRLPTPSERQAM